jgi:N-acetylglutamate synthase-like GNAT family acetyltransferase
MATRVLPATGVRVRRGRRRDLPQMQAVLGLEAAGRLVRTHRRILADPASEVYVAEEPGGAIVGLVSVVYARSLTRGDVAAVLDGARARHPLVQRLLDELVAFAEERARRRGCRRLAAWVDPGDAALRAALVARGYRRGDVLETDLEGGA